MTRFPRWARILLPALLALVPLTVRAGDAPRPYVQPQTEVYDTVAASNGQPYRIYIARPIQPAPPKGYPVIYALDGNAGVVESMTIRTVRLRDTNGNLHVIPFSEITKIVNHSKTYAFARVDVGVAYDSDLDKVMRVMHDVGVELRQDPEVGSFIVADTDVQGVETLGDSSITIRCRVKTQPGKQWDVRRAYLLQVKKAFDRENIEIPFPTIKHIRHVEGGVSSLELPT